MSSRRRSRTLDSEHRTSVRQLTGRAHGTNLDLGAALLQKLASVDPADMDVARFFAYGLLGPDERGYLGTGDHTVATIAANGIRLVIEQHRTTTTPTLKSGEPGRTKVEYGDVEDAAAWLWKFVEGARSAGRALRPCARRVRRAALRARPGAGRRASAAARCCPRSRKEIATQGVRAPHQGRCCPPPTLELQRALEREARAYAKRQHELSAAAHRSDTADTAADSEGDGDGAEDLTEA